MAQSLQWLIDIIKELIPSINGYVNRGNPANFDWQDVDLILDNAWHTLDISGIVPEDTIAIHLRITATTNFINNRIRFRKEPAAGFANVADVRFFIAGRTVSEDKIVSLTAARTCQYRISGASWGELGITVGGWFGPES